MPGKKREKTTYFKGIKGAVVQWLALWTLNPEIRVQVSAGPYIGDICNRLKRNYMEPLGFGSMPYFQLESFPPNLRSVV